MSTQVAEVTNLKLYERSLIRGDSRLEATRFCLSEREGQENNGDRVGVILKIIHPHNRCDIQLTRSEWEAFKNGIDAGFADFPIESK